MKVKDSDGVWRVYKPVDRPERSEPNPPTSITALRNRDTELDTSVDTTEDKTSIGVYILDYTNRYRSLNNKPPLRWSQCLCDIAVVHSRAMMCGTRPVGHDGSKERFSSYAFVSRASAENVAKNHGSNSRIIADNIVNSWIASPGHRKNLIGDFDACGIGISVSSMSQSVFATQLFGVTGSFKLDPLIWREEFKKNNPR
eukprot:GHVR01047099.1.p1 GENE.GHVR01047099.1~~GHVR01047099.1.p1  ORF type:complete len:199 (-),score=33.13 GHVR01047099.1:57-653(-)